MGEHRHTLIFWRVIPAPYQDSHHLFVIFRKAVTYS